MLQPRDGAEERPGPDLAVERPDVVEEPHDVTRPIAKGDQDPRCRFPEPSKSPAHLAHSASITAHATRAPLFPFVAFVT